MKYNHFEIDEMLSNMIIIYDTREQDTPALHKRLEGFGCPSERIKLDYGDYSCKTIDPSGEEINLSNVSVVERKMNLENYAIVSQKADNGLKMNLNELYQIMQRCICW